MNALDRLALSQAATGAAKMFLLDPDGEVIKARDGAESYIEFLGPDSEAVTKARNEAQRRMTRKALARNSRSSKRATPSDADIDDIIAMQRRNEADMLRAATIDWVLVDSDGERLSYPVTPENVDAFFASFPEVKEDAIAFCADRASFLGGDRS